MNFAGGHYSKNTADILIQLAVVTLTVISISPIFVCQSALFLTIHCVNSTLHLGRMLDSARRRPGTGSFSLLLPPSLSVLSASIANSTCTNSSMRSSLSVPQLRSTIVSVSLQTRSRSQRSSTRRLRQSKPGATSRPPSVSRSSPVQPSARPSAAICCRLNPSSSRCVRCVSACGPGGAQPFSPATVTRSTSRSSRRCRCSHELRLRRCQSVNDGTLSRIRASITQQQEDAVDRDSFSEPFWSVCTGVKGCWVKKLGGSSHLRSSSTCKVSTHNTVTYKVKKKNKKLKVKSKVM